MAVPTRAVHVDVHEADGTPIQGAVFTAKLTIRDTYQAQVLDRVLESTTTDADGEATLNLFPNVLGEEDSSYLFTIRHPTTNRVILKGVARVPDSDCELTDILGNAGEGLDQAGAENFIKDLIAPGLVAKIGIDQYAMRSVIGTANQVNVTNGDGQAGNITLSLPQSIAPSSSPTFAGLTLTGALVVGAIVSAGSIQAGTQFLAPDGAAAAPAYAFSAEPTVGWYRIAAGRVGLSTGAIAGADFHTPTVDGYTLRVAGIEFNCNQADVKLLRDGANILAQRNGLNAQSWRLYATYANGGVDHERIAFTFTGANWQLVSQAGGTGTVRPIQIGAASDTVTTNIIGNNQTIATFQPTASAVNKITFQSQTTGSYPNVLGQGTDADVGLSYGAKGAGFHTFRTSSGTAEQVRVVHIASSVNYWQMQGSATGNNPVALATGSDTNVGLTVSTRGSGALSFLTNSNSSIQFQVTHTASAVNNLQATGSATANTPIIIAAGSDANIEWGLVSKGTLPVRVSTNGTANNIQFKVTHTASAVNHVEASGSATTGAVTLSSNGADAAVPLFLRSRGAARITFVTDWAGTNVEQFRVAHAASAVNALQIYGGPAGSAPAFEAFGSDVNVGPAYIAKGSGTHRFYTNGGGTAVEQFRLAHTASAVNFIQGTGNATAGFPLLSAQGSDTNVTLRLQAKGSGGLGLETSGPGGTTQFVVAHAASAVNFLQAVGSATGNRLHLTAAGTDVNVAVGYSSLGSGALDFFTNGQGNTRQFQVFHTASAVNYVGATGSTTGSGVGLSSGGTDAAVSMNYSAKGVGQHNFATGGGTQFFITNTATAVNQWSFTGRATANGPIVQTVGTDVNVDMILSTKGTGLIAFYTNATNQKQFEILHTASAVNFWRVTGSATGASMTLSAQGSDTNITANIASKGTGIIQFLTNGGAQLQMAVAHVASAVNYVQLAGAPTGGNVTISAQGSDSNIGLSLSGKGTGDVLVDDNLVVTGATMVQNSQSAAYTLVASDANKHIYHPTTDNNARTFTIPANASVAYAIGTCLTFVNEINTVTIAITSDTLVLAGTGATGSRTLAANGVATAVKVTSTRWVISGTGLT